MQALRYRHTNLVNKDVLKLCSAKLCFVSFSPRKKSLTAALFIKESVVKKSGKKTWCAPSCFDTYFNILPKGTVQLKVSGSKAI